MYGRWSSRLCSASSTDGDIVENEVLELFSAVCLRSCAIRSVSTGRGSGERGVE